MARNTRGSRIDEMMGYDSDPWGESGGNDPWTSGDNEPSYDAPHTPDPWSEQPQENQQNSHVSGSPWYNPQQGHYRQGVQDAYKKWLGRDASDFELEDQFKGNYSTDHYNNILRAVQYSQEARDYAARQQAAAQQPQTSQQDTSGWNTDGYAIPGFTSGTFNQQAFSGWDQAKWADPNHQTPKYVVGRIMASHPNSPEGRAAMIADIQKAYPGSQFNGKDKMTIPGLGTIDIFGAAGAGEFRPQWIDEANAGGGLPPGGPSEPVPGMFPPGGGPSSGAPAPSGSGTGSGGGGGQYGPPPGVSDELWNMLMQRAKQGLNVERDNPQIRTQADAYAAQADRARRNFLGETAERSSPYATGAMLGQQRMSAERLGQDVGGFEANLIGREIEARRNEIQQALSQMGDMLTEQQRQQLQLQIAQMNDSLERLKSDRQNSQYFAGLGQDDRHFYSGLNQSNNHFYDRLGFDMDDRDRYWDWEYRNF